MDLATRRNLLMDVACEPGKVLLESPKQVGERTLNRKGRVEAGCLSTLGWGDH